jgi:pimeloyl-ACP methyl ester carboxylesterase
VVGKRPLLVGLHTWSGDYRQSLNGPDYAKWCAAQDWHFVFPHFRGPNRTVAAMGSDLAVRDVVDAVNHMRNSRAVDDGRIYLIGVSGGGHMALLLAGRHPELWAGVSAWCGINDIAAWHQEHVREGVASEYAIDIESALGGSPSAGGSFLAEAGRRSPATWLSSARNVPLDINHGLHDGRAGSVPFHHGLEAFQAVHPDVLSHEGIQEFYRTRILPSGWDRPSADPLYSTHPVRFRMVRGNTRVSIFEGGHEILYHPALNWLSRQRRGSPAQWDIDHPVPFTASGSEAGR